jgi:peptidoglycan hydrolase CwlO-like protein
MKKSISLSVIFSLFAVPFSVNASVLEATQDLNSKSSQSQIIITGIFDDIEEIKDAAEGTADDIQGTEEHLNEINDNGGEIKSVIDGGEEEESDEVVEETEVLEGEESLETVENTGDSF